MTHHSAPTDEPAAPTLGVFPDVNELIRAALGYYDDSAPTALEAGGVLFQGDPAALVVLIAAQRVIVNRQRIVLCTSERTLILMRAKLAETYHWDRAVLDEYTKYVMAVVKASGGRVCRSSEVRGLASYGELDDVEDLHRLSEASACDAELFLTQDAEVLQAWRDDPERLRPMAMTAREFINRARGSAGS